MSAANRSLQPIIQKLQSNPQMPYPEATSLLSRAKILLLKQGALTPTASVPADKLSQARDVYEAGALFSIRARDADAFTRYVAQLQPFYEQQQQASASAGERNKITGLYLLLLLTQGRYAEFHSELEALACREQQNQQNQQQQQQGGGEIENDRFLGYPIKLERWLMEGSYDRVWRAMKSREVPSEEYGAFSEVMLFSPSRFPQPTSTLSPPCGCTELTRFCPPSTQILTSQIRSEIASSSERAYPSLPLSSTKSLLFLESEGAVVEFARSRGWTVHDGHIYFPSASSSAAAAAAGQGAVLIDVAEKEFSQSVIENTLGYARELETIV